MIIILEAQRAKLFGVESRNEAFTIIKKEYDEQIKQLKRGSADAGKRLSNMFKFCEEVFGSGQEMLIIVTELTTNPKQSI